MDEDPAAKPDEDAGRVTLGDGDTVRIDHDDAGRTGYTITVSSATDGAFTAPCYYSGEHSAWVVGTEPAERRQSGRGRQPAADHLRTVAGRPADGDHPPGRIAGVPGAAGARGGVPDADAITHWIDYHADNRHDHPRPFCHIHTHWSYSDGELCHANHLHADGHPIPHPR